MDLYSCSSVLTNFEGYTQINMRWFRTERRHLPPEEYAAHIQDYDRLTDDERRIMEEYFDERFEPSEAEQLADYLLRRHGWTVKLYRGVEPESYLLDSDGRHTHGYMMMIGWDGPNVAFYRLAEEEGYDLPFAVWGYYNPGRVPRTAG